MQAMLLAVPITEQVPALATNGLLTAANSAASGHVGRETADGSVGDGRAAGDEIRGAVTPASTSAGLYTGVRLFRPYVDDSTGS